MYKHGEFIPFTLYINQDTRDWLFKLGKHRQMSMNDIVRQLVVNEINNFKKENPHDNKSNKSDATVTE